MKRAGNLSSASPSQNGVCPPDAFISGYPASVIAQGDILDAGIDFRYKRVSHDELARKVREILDRT